ncbi:exodeoxyribonuclease V subunit alpha [Candidatus Palibaumannia cicadellinicola]|uniref:RecBCD enzyme subunit RecD n=1 Tax=Candidatus Palibaumannia cicadellinicola TaxID=186490 RepID=A0A088MZ29_9GAMM|nr:exodeoxyribonuclease V subunit alpha [Candidatus Baumannia cicadellinicola]AIN47469.1 Exodeoxyribonuclease V alpha chain [Candidatus Baumannia cicadellinicola]
MEEIILQAQKLCLWRPLDIQFARMVAAPSHSPQALLLASACLSADVGLGHVCLPLLLLTPKKLFDGRYPKLALQAWQQVGSLKLKAWQHLLLTSPSVSDGSRSTPLVLDNQRLYLHRMWRYECTIAYFFQRQFRPRVVTDENRIRAVLNRLFPTKDQMINWHKIAIAVALIDQVVLISGGPGTGKTTIVAKLLAAILLLSDNARLRIMIAAPTGKAAARLSESLAQAIQKMQLDNSLRQQIACQAITLHRLLGAQPNSQRMRYHNDNQLHIDVLIIDEASMVDFRMMANIIDALPAHTRVIFLGDRYQLASVETGAVFRDLCQFANTGYSVQRCQELSRLTGYRLSTKKNHEGRYDSRYKIADSLCLLRKSYRFNYHSGISRLAHAINVGDIQNTLALLNSKQYADIHYIPRREEQDYQKMINDSITSYYYYLKLVYAGESPHAIIAKFNNYRLLTTLREGQFGVSGLNSSIEQMLMNYGLIKKIGCSYAGRPIIILHNAPSLGLYNGDIGMVLSSGQHILCAYFILPDSSIKAVPISCLPKHETAFAMTVHKSQGSEFTHTALVLPDNICPVLTRELLYTGVTRARQLLYIYAPDNGILAQTIATTIQRRSGLKERFLSEPNSYTL